MNFVKFANIHSELQKRANLLVLIFPGQCLFLGKARKKNCATMSVLLRALAHITYIIQHWASRTVNCTAGLVFLALVLVKHC